MESELTLTVCRRTKWITPFYVHNTDPIQSGFNPHPEVGYLIQIQSGFNPRPEVGYLIMIQSGFNPRPEVGYLIMIQSGFNPHPEVGYLIMIQSGFNPRPEVGYLIQIGIRIRVFTCTRVSLIRIRTRVKGYV